MAVKLPGGMEVPPGVLKFALFGVEGGGCSIGANRNALLLHTSGDMPLSVDDDAVSQIARVPPTSNRALLRRPVLPVAVRPLGI